MKLKNILCTPKKDEIEKHKKYFCRNSMYNKIVITLSFFNTPFILQNV